MSKIENPSRPVRIPRTEERKAEIKAMNNKAISEYRKRERQRIAAMSPEQREDLAKEKQWQKERRIRDKAAAAQLKIQKAEFKRELALLEFMLASDVIYYHHGRGDSMKAEITQRIDTLKQRKKEGNFQYTEYDSYYWNYSPDQTSYMPLSLLGCLWNGNESIYDVPLDGTFKFQIHDSGTRGLGSFNYISAIEVGQPAFVPYVNPGAFPPITC